MSDTTTVHYVQGWSERDNRWVTRRTPFTAAHEARAHAELLAADRDGKSFRVIETTSSNRVLGYFGPAVGDTTHRD